MHHFHYHDAILHAEEVSLATIAAQVGTPAYVYSQATLERHFRAFDRAFADLDHLVCFAVKANTSKAIMALFASLGGGADIVSGGEMQRAIAAGVEPARIVYSGVGKTEAEMEAAIVAGIRLFNLESVQEMEVLDQVAGRLGRKAPVAIRVNPDVDAGTHPKITTGLAKNKFGLTVEDSLALYGRARQAPNLTVKGISCHIGSQLTDTRPFADALERLAALVGRLREDGFAIEYLDLGAAWASPTTRKIPPNPTSTPRPSGRPCAAWGSS